MFNNSPFDSGVPIYLQLIQRIKMKILSGEWEPGQRIPPVRDLALDLGVNPNTMQRSMTELEREGLVYSERTAGRFITQDRALIDAVRAAASREEAAHYRKQMHAIGLDDAQALSALEDRIREKPKEDTL